MSGRKKSLQLRNRKGSKQANSSWQPTLNHYFGGSSVPVQPTLHHVLKKAFASGQGSAGEGVITVDDDKEDDGCSDGREKVLEGDGSEIRPRKVLRTLTNSPPSGGIGVQQWREALPKRPLLVERQTKGHSLTHNPFAVTTVREHHPSISLDTVSVGDRGVGRRKSLSLKTRKRSLPTSPARPNHASKSVKMPKPGASESGGRWMVPSCSTVTGLSREECEVLNQYGCGGGRVSSAPTLRDLDEFEQCKQEVGAIAMETGTHCKVERNRLTLVPRSPAFSPCRPSPTRLHLPLPPPSPLNTSLPLFSTPSPYPTAPCPREQPQGQPRAEDTCTRTSPEDSTRPLIGTEGGSRRTLFPPVDDTGPADTINPSADCSVMIVPNQLSGEASLQETAGGDFSFGGDFSLLDDQLMASQESHELQRYLVLECVTQECVEESALLSTGRYKPEVMLRLFDEHISSERLCYLRDDWLETDISPGDMVQVNAQFDETRGCYVVDNAGPGSVIVNPDQLISGTTVAAGVTCARRAILSEQFRGGGGGTNGEAMVFGQMLHTVFQKVITATTQGLKVTKAGIQDEIKKVVSCLEHLEQLYGLGISDSETMSKLSEFAPSIEGWCRRFLHGSPQPGLGTVEFSRPGSHGASCVAVTEVLDIEENIWSPRYGLKGRVDASVRIKERKAGGEEESFVAPLEVKTGKMFRPQGSIEHRAQVNLYSLMMGDGCYGDVPGGMLYYMKTGHMHGMPIRPHDRRGLLIARNHLAGYYSNRRGHMSIPGLLKDKATCKHCPYAPECMLIHRSTEEGTAATSGVPDVFNSHTLDLSQSHLHFFSHWYSLVREEHMHCRETEGPPVWMSVAMEREKEGRCLGDVIAKLATVGQRGKKFQSFVKREGVSGVSSRTVALSLNDRVIVSYQDGSRWAVAMGIITSVTSPVEVQLCIDKPVPCNDVVYRLDVVDNHVSSGMPLSNLTQVCLSDSKRDCRLRELVIDLVAPRFTHQLTDEVTPFLSTLNDSQRLAVSQVLRCHDYSLILGMPGTGKTTTIACLVQALVARGNTILLTSYTHSAVDNILLKLKEAGVDFVRLGSAARIHPDIVPFTPAQSLQGVTSVQQLEYFYQSKTVVATTCLGINHPLFLRRSFDYCILDEATQITLPVSLGPLRHASQFVLVGDHYQLPPLVQSEGGRAGGLDVSLFRRLTEHHPQAMVTLEYQYRMNSDIMFLSNSLVYNSRLKCGSEGVASSRLCVPRLPQLHKEVWQSREAWLWRAVDPDQPVVFLNTDAHTDRKESCSGDHIHNTLEVQMVVKLVDVFAKGGVPPSSIGVITPYRYQQRLISEALHSCEGKGEGLEVNTVDRYQGRDKDCIIVSLIRCNDKKNVGRLLLDWRRVNVALTRARHKLILIGSLATLQSSPVLQCLGALLRQKQWVQQVGPEVHDPIL